MAFHILPHLLRAYHGNDLEIGANSLHVLTRLQPDMGQLQAQALSAVAPWSWHRVVSTLAHVLGFGLIGLVLHEFFHLVVLQALGGEGFITFDWELGFTHFTEQPSYLWVVQLSGGLLTGVFLLFVFWFWAWSSGAVNNTSIEVAAFAWALGSLAYAPTELLASSPTIGLVAFVIGFSAAAAVYFMKLMNWVAGPE